MQSQLGSVGFKVQGAKGVHADPGSNGLFLPIKSGSLGGTRELLIPDPEIGGNRDIPDMQLAPMAYAGEYDLYVRMDSFPFFMRAALGSDVMSGSPTAGFTHVVTATDTIPWVSVEERIASTFTNFRYTDAKLNTLHIEADATGYLAATAGWISLTQTTNAAPTAEINKEIDTGTLLPGTAIQVEWAGSLLPAKSFSLDINNNLEDDDFRLGSQALGDAVEKRREITVGVNIRPNSSAIWKTAMYGGPAATVPGGKIYKDLTRILITTYYKIPGTVPPIPYTTIISIPHSVVVPHRVDPSGDDALEADIEIRALAPVPGVPILTSTHVNGWGTGPGELLVLYPSTTLQPSTTLCPVGA